MTAVIHSGDQTVPALVADPSDPTPGAVVMVRPQHFRPNEQTLADNTFQHHPTQPADSLAASAFEQVTRAADTLAGHGVAVHLFEDGSPERPDSVFCNNWFSTHPDGRVVLYPMRMANRRSERRTDIVQRLGEAYAVTEVVDLSAAEQRGRFLEGTGAMVFDHHYDRAFIAASGRADRWLATAVCRGLGYEPVIFDTADRRGVPIYHTNVMMSVGRDIALIGLSSISDRTARGQVRRLLAADGARTVIDLDLDQIEAFAGNMLELRAGSDRLLAMSQTAERALRPRQRRTIEQHCTIVPLAVPALETAGGSVRCMLADVHLPRHPQAAPIAL